MKLRGIVIDMTVESAMNNVNNAASGTMGSVEDHGTNA